VCSDANIRIPCRRQFANVGGKEQLANLLIVVNLWISRSRRYCGRRFAKVKSTPLGRDDDQCHGKKDLFVAAVATDGCPDLLGENIAVGREEADSSGSRRTTGFTCGEARRTRPGKSLNPADAYLATAPFAPETARHRASGRMPASMWRQVVGAAIGTPASARGEYVPIAVVPRPLRR
jgi:hypothetical protein